MIKSLLTTTIIFAMVNTNFAQDIITKKIDGTITAKIIEISKKEVKYKKFDNLTGPTFTIDLSEITMIQYENGTKDVFNEPTDSPFKLAETADMKAKGILDANVNYNADNCGKGWTAATTILFSPIIGIIPAVACASSRPQDRNLNYRDGELMKNTEYNLAYKGEAMKIKRKRVWRSFGISSAIWGVLYIVSLNQPK